MYLVHDLEDGFLDSSSFFIFFSSYKNHSLIYKFEGAGIRKNHLETLLIDLRH